MLTFMKIKLPRLFFLFLLMCTVWSCKQENQKSINSIQVANQHLGTHPDSVIYYGLQAIAYNTSDNDLIDAHFLIAYTSRKQKKYAEAINHYLEAILLSNKKKENLPQLTSLHKNLGFIFEIHKNYALAEEQYQMALNYSNDKSKAGILYNLSGLYHDQENFEKAIEFGNNAFALAEKNENKSRQARTLNLFGLIKSEQGLFLESREALEQVIGFGIPKYMAKANHNLGNSYLIEKKYAEAIPYFQKALALKSKPKDQFITLMDLGECEIELGNHESALAYLHRAESMYASVDAIPKHLEKAYMLSEQPAKRNQYDAQHEAALETFIDRKEKHNNQLSAGNVGSIYHNFNKKQEVKKDLSNRNLAILAISIVLTVILTWFALNTVRSYLSKKRVVEEIKRFES